MKRYYIAYGSNLNKDQMMMRCPGAKATGTSILDGWELLFKGSKTGSYLTIERAEGATTPVAIWEVTPEDEQSLDRYEGYPSFYYKRQFDMVCGGKKIKAFAYIMHEDRPIGIPTQFYIQTCLKGYDDFGFDSAVLRSAYLKCEEVVRNGKN
jgi:hypothetical protein